MVEIFPNLLEGTGWEFIRLFKKGKQGIVGLVRDIPTGKRSVFKVSQHIDYVCEHEETVALRLNRLGSPLFVRLTGSQRMKINPDSKAANPWIGCHRPIKRLVLFFEYVKGYSLSKAIKSGKYSCRALIGCVKTIIVGLHGAHEACGFTHYDLHTSNIIVRECEEDHHLLIHVNESNVFSIATHGLIPVVIDFGFSYIDKIDEGPMYQSLAHTNVGFVSCAPDPFADTKLFLASFSSHFLRYRRGKSSLRLRKLFKDIFRGLPIDYDSGWDKTQQSSVANQTLEYLCAANSTSSHDCISELFDRYDHFAVDIMGSMVLLPLDMHTTQDRGDKLLRSYRVFLKQFRKIEDVILSSFTRMEVLKIIVDSARECTIDYFSGEPSLAESRFQHLVMKGVDEVVTQVSFKHVKWNKMLCSLVMFTQSLEIWLSHKLKEVMMHKRDVYRSGLTVRNTVEVFGAIDLKISTDREITERSYWSVIKPWSEIVEWKPHTEADREIINTSHSLTRGTIVNAIHLKKKIN
jgi:hypothetical protein